MAHPDTVVAGLEEVLDRIEEGDCLVMGIEGQPDQAVTRGVLDHDPPARVNIADLDLGLLLNQRVGLTIRLR